jgi:ATP-dependent protease ClpP protease subunit
MLCNGVYWQDILETVGIEWREVAILQSIHPKLRQIVEEAKRIGEDWRKDVRVQAAHKRATEGVEDPIHDKDGNLVGHRTIYSDRLLEFLLKDAKPEIYAPKAAGADVELIISSRGGLVGAALEIYNMIRAYPGQTTAILSGYAMSAASYIPMACKRVLAEDNAVFMVHNAWGVAIGDHREMRKVGGILGGLSNLLAGAYARFTGKSREKINQLLDDETWLFGEEIVAAGATLAGGALVLVEQHEGRTLYLLFKQEQGQSTSTLP